MILGILQLHLSSLHGDSESTFLGPPSAQILGAIPISATLEAKKQVSIVEIANQTNHCVIWSVLEYSGVCTVQCLLLRPITTPE